MAREGVSGKAGWSELGLRLISAALLIPFALWVVWKGGIYLAAGCGLFAALMAYEWVRMTASPLMRPFVWLAIAPFLAIALAEYFWRYESVLIGFGVLALCTGLAALLHPLSQERLMSGFGLAYVSGMPLGLYALRAGPWDGVAAALFFMSIVWASDSAAYFAGRGFGGPALSRESPSKTWSGALGAIVCSVLCGLIAARVTGGNPVVWAFAGGAISVIAQWGDLFESSLKRKYNVKDASGLLPGHGGILDRVDGLGVVCSVGALILSLSTTAVDVLGLGL